MTKSKPSLTCSRANARSITAIIYEHRVLVYAGEQAFCPVDMAHAPVNESEAPCTWIVVHSSGSDQDGIVLLPELDAALAARLDAAAKTGA